ncbi:MAG: hypothetical protein RRA92_06240 [Gemmatimonadota bacterium]|nr:hypothetical protein [Gemmatimonadota bacterium]
MQHRTVLVTCLLALLAWAGCDERPVADSTTTLTGPMMARGGVDACDTKSARTREYFQDRADRQAVDALFRDLAAACVDGDGASAATIGFAILETVESARAARTTGLPDDGATVVAVAWNLMAPFLCEGQADCTAPPIGPDGTALELVAGALDLQGAFGVRSAGSDPVISWGNDDPLVPIPLPYWGVEPFTVGVAWSAVIPGGRGMILGSPDLGLAGALNETSLGAEVAYDWTVLPWYQDVSGAEPVSVAVCADTGDPILKEKIAHKGTLLQDGRPATWCGSFTDPLLAASAGSRLARLAAAVLPFWPRPLNAGALKESGAGKAVEFSPYWGYEVDPEGLVAFLAPPARSKVGQPICAAAPEGGCAGPIRVHLTTKNLSPFSGGESVTLVITAKDNNGSWTMSGTPVGSPVPEPGDGYGLVYEWTDLTLDKPGGYELYVYRTDADGCVVDEAGAPVVDPATGGPVCGENTIGLDFPAVSSEKFIVDP